MCGRSRDRGAACSQSALCLVVAMDLAVPPAREFFGPHWRSVAGAGLLAVTVLLGMSAAGCVRYHAEPLEPATLDTALAAPPHDVLAREAAALQHPRLRPVTLDFSKPLTEDELGVIAVLVNPELNALRVQEHVAEAQVFVAGLLPDPQLAGGFDAPLAAPGGVGGLFSAYNVGPNWPLAALVTRPATVRIARRHADQVRFDVAWQEWMVANQARLLARRLTLLRQQEAVAVEAGRLAGQLLDLTRRNLERGDATLADLGVREAGYLDAQDRALSLARDVEKARQDLDRTLGLPPGESLTLAPTPVAMVAPADGAALFARAREERLDLIALRAGYASQEARVYREVLGQYPAVGLAVNNARDTTGVLTLGFSLTLDLPLFNRNRGALRVAVATREQLYEEYVNRLHQTRADVAQLVADLGHVVQEYDTLNRELPRLVRAEAGLRAAVETGDVTLLEYETVRAALLDKELKRLSLEQQAAEQDVGLQIAVGGRVMP
jgi:cobalt-zinc-cadmium efflux system outer membrane protein